MLRNNKDIQAKGILLSTFLFGVLIIYLKFFLNEHLYRIR